jgi:hypothetical protein
MPYQLFQRTGIRIDSPSVSIAPDGRLALNAAAARLMATAGIKHVVLLWDKRNLKMAIRATIKGDRNGYAVSAGRNIHRATLRAKAFVDHIGWIASKREALPATWNEKERMFEVSLPPDNLLQQVGGPPPRTIG